MVICGECRRPIAPGGCECGFMARRPIPKRGNRYAKPLIPPVLPLPTACLLGGFGFGVIVGLILSVVIRRVF